MNNIDQFVCKIAAALQGIDPTNVTGDCDASIVTINALTSGSTVVDGSSGTGTAANLQAGSSSIGYVITGMSVSDYQHDDDNDDDRKGGSNIGMAVGLAIGIIVLGTIFLIQW